MERALRPQTRITAQGIRGLIAAERTRASPERVRLATLCIFFYFPELNRLNALRKELYEEQHPQTTHLSALRFGQYALSLSEGCGLAGGTMFLPIPLSQALRCSQTGPALPVQPTR